MNNKHLSWYKEINNNFIIDSREYFFQTMGYSIDSLDVCFGDQLAGSAEEPMHRGWHTFVLCY